jgi:methyl-accepting chemotaxis protein
VTTHVEIIWAMYTNPYVEGRERLASIVTTLPRELLETNAAPLMGILSELQSSSVIEIGVIQLNEVLEPLRHADDDLLDDIERILGDSLTAIREIEGSSRLADARSAQARFTERMQPTIDRIRNNLSRMNALTGQLIDLM